MTNPADDPTIADLIDRGLHDPDAADAEARLPFLKYALELGATVEELEQGRDNLGQIIARRVLRPAKERLTATQAASRAAVSVDDAIRMWRICGFRDPLPQEKVFTEEDVEMLRVFDTSRRLFGEELTTQLARVLGSAMARVADAAISTFATNVRSQSQTKPLTLEEVRAANQTAAAMLPAAVRVMDVLLRHHMESRSRGPISLAGEFEGVDVLQRTVGFCDLVGYTSLAETLSATEISAVLNDFEGTVSDVIAAGGGNVVKLIGDEVMFITHEGSTACDIALNLADAFGHDGGLPPVRCGLASGQVILREGDYHGAVVNLAARIVKVASPGDVLAPASFVETIDTSHAFDNVGPLDLAGFERPVEIVVVRRA